MMHTTAAQASATARIPFNVPFLPLAMEFAERGARGFGYGDREAAGLVLAMEELFSFYSRRAAADAAADIELQDQGYRLSLSLSFPAANPDMRAFNLTWRASHDSEESLDMLGPMIAARCVSSLRLEFGARERVSIRLTRDREYAAAPAVELPPPGLTGTPRLVTPCRDDLRHFAAMVTTAAPPFVPPFLARPAMAADMLAAGHLNALLALNSDWIVGGLLWRPLTEQCSELYGPYLFTPDPDERVLTMLMDEAIGRISHSRSRGVLRRQGPLRDHERFFDFLGDLELAGTGGETSRCSYYYRQLREENGGVVYCGPRLASFLGDQYDRLCLPRQLRESSDDQQRRDASVLAVELDCPRGLATLRPLCAGRDMADNLAAHLRLLGDEGISTFIVEINTGRGEETVFADALEQTGFVPRLLVPDAGQGDLVVYQHAGGSAAP